MNENSNSQANIEDLLDEIYDVLDKGWKLPLSSGRIFVDAEEIRAILDDLREEIPNEVRKAQAIVADRAQIIEDAHREADVVIRTAQEKAQSLVAENEIVRQAQLRANELLTQAQGKYREMRQASSEYVDDLLKRADDSLSENLSELRKTRQNIKNSQRNNQM